MGSFSMQPLVPLSARSYVLRAIPSESCSFTPPMAGMAAKSTTTSVELRVAVSPAPLLAVTMQRNVAPCSSTAGSSTVVVGLRLQSALTFANARLTKMCGADCPQTSNGPTRETK